jgi:hypothetical protein
MTKLFRIEHNIETGEVSKIELTNEEIATAQNDENARIARFAAEEAKVTEKAALLAKLGITDDEAKLLLS